MGWIGLVRLPFGFSGMACVGRGAARMSMRIFLVCVLVNGAVSACQPAAPGHPLRASHVSPSRSEGEEILPLDAQRGL